MSLKIPFCFFAYFKRNTETDLGCELLMFRIINISKRDKNQLWLKTWSHEKCMMVCYSSQGQEETFALMLKWRVCTVSQQHSAQQYFSSTQHEHIGAIYTTQFSTKFVMRSGCSFTQQRRFGA